MGQSGSGSSVEWRFGCGTGEGSGSRTSGSGVSVCVRRQCPFALVQCSGAMIYIYITEALASDVWL